jgi:hypothetical protein
MRLPEPKTHYMALNEANDSATRDERTAVIVSSSSI